MGWPPGRRSTDREWPYDTPGRATLTGMAPEMPSQRTALNRDMHRWEVNRRALRDAIAFGVRAAADWGPSAADDPELLDDLTDQHINESGT